MSFRFAFKTSFAHLQDVLARYLACHGKTSARCLFADWGNSSYLVSILQLKDNPVDTRRRFNVYKTSIRRRRRRTDVETTSCVYWEMRHII